MTLSTDSLRLPWVMRENNYTRQHGAKVDFTNHLVMDASEAPVLDDHLDENLAHLGDGRGAYIVRAVNAHEALVAALEAMCEEQRHPSPAYEAARRLLDSLD